MYTGGVLAALLLCAASAARAPYEPEPILVAQAQPFVDHLAPPVLFAQTMVPASPVVSIWPIPESSAMVAQMSAVRVVSPNGAQPGVLWVIAMGAVLCRVGARVVRVS